MYHDVFDPVTGARSFRVGDPWWCDPIPHHQDDRQRHQAGGRTDDECHPPAEQDRKETHEH